VAGAHGVVSDDPRVLADSSNVLVWLRPAPVVARVAGLTARVRPDGGAAWLGHEVAVAAHLATAGAPALGPSPELAPGPHQHEGRWMTFWPYVPEDTTRTVSVEDAAALLRDVHEALGDFDGELPALGPFFGDLPRIMEELRVSAGIGGADAERLAAEWERLAPALRAPGPARALHGDAHVGNMLIPRGGDPLWSDFEDACTGPVAWDLACLRMHSSAFGDAALEAYGLEPDAEQLELCTEARMLQSTIWTCLLAQQRPAIAERAQAALARYRRALET
jgi:aminoglycoside phosphotransferase (APT) family kinase protein